MLGFFGLQSVQIISSVLLVFDFRSIDLSMIRSVSWSKWQRNLQLIIMYCVSTREEGMGSFNLICELVSRGIILVHRDLTGNEVCLPYMS